MADKIVWAGDRERRIRQAMAITGPESPRFNRDDMRAALDEIDRLRAAFDRAVADSEAQVAFTDFFDGNAEWSNYASRSVGRMREVLSGFLRARGCSDG